MALSIYFKTNGVETQINSDYIRRLDYTANMFSQSFKLGGTVCKQFDVDIDKLAFANITTTPDEVVIYDGNSVYATLVVDELNTEDNAFYSYSLTDRMVRLLEEKDWFVSGATINTLLANICTEYDLGTPPTIANYGSMAVSWDEDISARDFVGYLAELLGGYAYIDSMGNLQFSTFTNVATDTISVSDCSSFKANETIIFDRVVYNSPTRVVKYPDDESYQGQESTYYVDIDNVLFTDSGNITIEDQVEYIYNIINHFSVCNITVEKAPINSAVKCGDTVAFTLNGNTYQTIAEINWQYNSMWLGGYTLDIQNELQEETQVESKAVKQTKKIRQYIDRELNQIGTSIEQLDANYDSLTETVNRHTTEITQNATAIRTKVSAEDVEDIITNKGYVTQTQLEQTAEGINISIEQMQGDLDNAQDELNTIGTYINFDANGVTVGKSDSEVRGVFGNDSLDFVNQSEQRLAWIDATEGLGATELSLGDPNTISNRWRVLVSEDGNGFIITRHQS